jgi:hypothetical protein
MQSKRPVHVNFDAEQFVYAMKIENLQDPSPEEKKQGVTKK